MARDSRGRFTARRPRAGGSARRPRIVGADYAKAKEVGGVLTGEPIVLGGVEAETSSPKATASKTT